MEKIILVCLGLMNICQVIAQNEPLASCGEFIEAPDDTTIKSVVRYYSTQDTTGTFTFYAFVANLPDGFYISIDGQEVDHLWVGSKGCSSEHTGDSAESCVPSRIVWSNESGQPKIAPLVSIKDFPQKILKEVGTSPTIPELVKFVIKVPEGSCQLKIEIRSNEDVDTKWFGQMECTKTCPKTLGIKKIGNVCGGEAGLQMCKGIEANWMNEVGHYLGKGSSLKIKEPGQYSAEYKFYEGCVVKEKIVVEDDFSEFLKPHVEYGACGEATLRVNTMPPAGTKYYWRSPTNQYLTGTPIVKESGRYTLIAESEQCRTASWVDVKLLTKELQLQAIVDPCKPNEGKVEAKIVSPNGTTETFLLALTDKNVTRRRGYLEVSLKDAQGCSYRQAIEDHEIKKSEFKIFVPNALSPNGDRSNDTFMFYGPKEYEDAVEIQIRIFDRWGNLVVENTSARLNEPLWDGGTYDPAVFVYTAMYRFKGCRGGMGTAQG